MKKKSPKIHHFYDEVFRQNYYVLRCASPDHMVDFAKKEHNVDLQWPDPSTIDATCWSPNNGYIYIWIGSTRKDRSSIIAHECAHAAISMFYEKGQPIVPESEEAFCYYLQYLVRNVTRACQGKL